MYFNRKINDNVIKKGAEIKEIKRNGESLDIGSFQLDRCRGLKVGGFKTDEFLLIWNFGRFINGVYDLWDSKNGDMIVIETETFKEIYKYKEDRYWLMKETEINTELEPYVEDSMQEESVSFDDIQESVTAEFKEAETLSSEGEFRCFRKCHFSENGVCRYFDWEIENPSGIQPDCGEPFIYMEQSLEEREV